MLGKHLVLNSPHLAKVFFEHLLTEVLDGEYLEKPVDELWVSSDFVGWESEENLKNVIFSVGHHWIFFRKFAEH